MEPTKEHKRAMNKNNGITVLSLCDGMSCGIIALTELGVKVNSYYAFEINKIEVIKHILSYMKI
jgi:DNA (cytosine-5)-methyltransferase 3A